MHCEKQKSLVVMVASNIFFLFAGISTSAPRNDRSGTASARRVGQLEEEDQGGNQRTTGAHDVSSFMTAIKGRRHSTTGTPPQSLYLFLLFLLICAVPDVDEAAVLDAAALW